MQIVIYLLVLKSFGLVALGGLGGVGFGWNWKVPCCIKKSSFTWPLVIIVFARKKIIVLKRQYSNMLRKLMIVFSPLLDLLFECSL